MDTDICLVVCDNEYRSIWTSIVEFFSLRVKHVKFIGLGNFLEVCKYAAYAGDCVVMYNTNVIFKPLRKPKNNKKTDVSINDDVTTSIFKDYDFTILNKYTNFSKTMKDLIIL
jgi:hypothetical protein